MDGYLEEEIKGTAKGIINYVNRQGVKEKWIKIYYIV